VARTRDVRYLCHRRYESPIHLTGCLLILAGRWWGVRLEDRGRRTEGGGPRTEDRGPRTEDRGRRAAGDKEEAGRRPTIADRECRGGASRAPVSSACIGVHRRLHFLCVPLRPLRGSIFLARSVWFGTVEIATSPSVRPGPKDRCAVGLRVGPRNDILALGSFSVCAVTSVVTRRPGFPLARE
jgi:hypothetical protein